MLAHDCREKVRPGTGREAGLGHAGGRETQGAVAEGSRDRTPLWNERPTRGAEQGPRRSRGCDRRWAGDRFEYHRGSSLHRGSDPHRCAAGPLFRPSKRCGRSYHLNEKVAPGILPPATMDRSPSVAKHRDVQERPLERGQASFSTGSRSHLLPVHRKYGCTRTSQGRDRRHPITQCLLTNCHHFHDFSSLCPSTAAR